MQRHSSFKEQQQGTGAGHTAVESLELIVAGGSALPAALLMTSVVGSKRAMFPAYVRKRGSLTMRGGGSVSPSARAQHPPLSPKAGQRSTVGANRSSEALLGLSKCFCASSPLAAVAAAARGLSSEGVLERSNLASHLL